MVLQFIIHYNFLRYNHASKSIGKPKVKNFLGHTIRLYDIETISVVRSTFLFKQIVQISSLFQKNHFAKIISLQNDKKMSFEGVSTNNLTLVQGCGIRRPFTKINRNPPHPQSYLKCVVG